MRNRPRTRLLPALAALALLAAGCGGSDGRVVIASNADAEVVAALRQALDEGGFRGRYLIQTLGTAELSGKLLAEGKAIESDIVTMSTYALESAQAVHPMFAALDFGGPRPLAGDDARFRPLTAQEGAIIANLRMLEEHALPRPKSLKDLADPVYAGFVSVTDLRSSSTAWLLMQALVAAYGEAGATDVLAGIYRNAGPHVESAGAAPLRKVRAGEVALGFGLRHQALADKARGMPIDVIDPAEGTYALTESLAVVDKGPAANARALPVARCLRRARPALLKTYPTPLYHGEAAEAAGRPALPRVFPQPLTTVLLAHHQTLADEARARARR